MPVIKYNNVPVRISNDKFLAKSATISYSASLNAARILAPNQNDNFRIGNPLAAKLSLSFVASAHNFGANNLINNLTGDVSTSIRIGTLFENCYCDSVAINITPFSPVLINAEFTCNQMPVNAPFQDLPESGIIPANQSIAHAHNVIINGGTLLSDSNYSSISYKVNCARSQSFEIGSKLTSRMFLDGVEKELNISSTNIGNFIDYSGYGDIISLDVKNDIGQSIFDPVISMSSNSRIMSQNLSIAEGGILAGDISLREIVL